MAAFLHMTILFDMVKVLFMYLFVKLQILHERMSVTGYFIHLDAFSRSLYL